MARAEPPEPQANLPQSYESPWGLLGRDLRAVTADLGLQLRALWRRNRQGDLSVPGFWPSPLQPLFWPFLLALLLALPWIGWSLLPHGPGPAASELTAPASATGPDRPGQRPLAAAQPPPAPAPRLRSPLDAGSVPDQQPGDAARDRAGDLLAVPTASEPPEPSAPPLALDPLLQLLAEADPEQLIVSAHPEPALALLRLTLAPAFAELPADRRSQWAERWCERAQELGYERFELVDVQQRPLGRKALIGSGMILLEPVSRQ